MTLLFLTGLFRFRFFTLKPVVYVTKTFTTLKDVMYNCSKLHILCNNIKYNNRSVYNIEQCVQLYKVKYIYINMTERGNGCKNCCDGVEKKSQIRTSASSNKILYVLTCGQCYKNLQS
jgi:hypothetical protein